MITLNHDLPTATLWINKIFKKKLTIQSSSSSQVLSVVLKPHSVHHYSGVLLFCGENSPGNSVLFTSHNKQHHL